MAAGGVWKRSLGAGLVRKAIYALPALFCLAFCVVAVPLQMILPSLPWMPAKPDLPAMLIAYAAFRLPLIPSFGLAALVGFWRDLLTAGHIGPYLLAFTLTSILVFLLRQGLFLRTSWVFPGVAALATFVILGTAYALQLLEHRQWVWSAASWTGFGISSLLTAVVSLPVGWLFDWSWGLLLPRTSVQNEDDLLEIELL
jgi:rod shape-determining protein MreD